MTLTVSDGKGGTSSDTAAVTIRDVTPPAIQSLSTSTHVLWPPNHKMTSVTVSATVTDNCDAAPVTRVVSVASNEPIDGLGDGDTGPDWSITGAMTVDLRAERSGLGNGRVYTITVESRGRDGNASTRAVSVHVPKDDHVCSACWWR